MKTGLISDRNYKDLTIFDNFRYAITTLYPDIKDVNSAKDLDGLDVVFLPHPNHGPHLQICAKLGFLERCNELGIKLVVFFSEKVGIDNSKPEIQYIRGTHDRFFEYFERINPILFKNIYSDEDQKLRCFNHLKEANNSIIYTYDVDDCIQFGLKLFRVALSKKFKYLREVIPFSKRRKEIVFCGHTYKNFTFDRNGLIRFIKRSQLPIDYRVKHDFPSWYEYMSFLSGYQYGLSPLGNGNGFASRFYELLTLKLIILQQVHKNTLQYYDKEAAFKNCIFFETGEDLLLQLKEYQISEEWSELWLEDILTELLTEINLL